MFNESSVKKKYFFLIILFFLSTKGVYAKFPVSYYYRNQVNKSLINTSKDRFVFGISYFNALRKKQNAIEGRLEYRSSLSLFNIKPFAGLSFTSSGGFYGMIGVYYDIILGNGFIFTPGFSTGYFNKGMGIDLAYDIEFRTNIELCYILQNNSRVGISFYHISNGNFGRSNPGAESISFIFSLPIDN